MTKEQFDKIDGFVGFIAYASLTFSVFIGIDYLNLRAGADLSEFGRTWTPIIVLATAVIFGVAQTLRLRAYRIHFREAGN